MDSEWLNRMCRLLAEHGVRTVRFEFGYMAARRRGVRKAPPRADALIGEYRDAVVEIARRSEHPVHVGGKSMGGRVASMAVDDLRSEGLAAGLAVFGYPFHPPGAPEKLRTAHLEDLRSPALILQGTRDPFGSTTEVQGYALSPSIGVHWLEDGDHELRPRVTVSGRTHAQNLEEAADRAADFIAAASASAPVGTDDAVDTSADAGSS